MKNINVTKMNKNIANGKDIEWTRHTCKESALAGRVKKLAPKVNAIVKEMDLDPDNVTVEFENVKPVGDAMFDTIKLHGEGFDIAVEFHTATKSSAGYVKMNISNETDTDEVECESWKELKSILSEYATYTVPADCEDCANDPEDEDDEEVDETEAEEVDETEAEEEDEVEECNENCSCCEAEEEEDEVEEEPAEDEFEDED